MYGIKLYKLTFEVLFIAKNYKCEFFISLKARISTVVMDNLALYGMYCAQINIFSV